ncbi:hypothetical protein [Nocardia sp. NPDC004860]|uniref:hypothetical protein n=1 Tax=Nocardia sp. NPDC004860 TaxID=3154557 RepID=UPI0033AA56FE
MTREAAVHPDAESVLTDEDIGREAAELDPAEAAGGSAADSENDSGAEDTDAHGDERTRRWAPRSLGRPSRRSIAVALAVLAIAGMSTAALLLAQAHRDSDRAGENDLALLGAVRQEAVNLISPSVKDPAGSADRIVKDATGQWLTEFQGTKDKFVGAINDSKTDSVGEILGAGIERHNPDGSTTVLVTAVSKVTNAAGAKGDPRTWRLRIDVVHTGGGYKLSKVEVVP